MLDNDPRRMLVRLAVAVMAADGRVSLNELACLDRLEQSGFGPLRSLVGSELDRAMHVPVNLAEACGTLAAANPRARAVAFAALVNVATADGLHHGEMRILDTIAPLLGLPEEIAADIIRTAAREA